MTSSSDIMDQKDVIDRITKEVLARIRDNSERNGSGTANPVMAGSNTIVVILSGKLDADALTEEIKSISDSANVISIVISQWASKGLSRHRLSHILEFNIVDEEDLGGIGDITSLIQGIDSIYIPDLDIAAGL